MNKLLEKNRNLIFYGLGKDRMKQEGLHCIHDMTSKSVMWLHVLKELRSFLKMKRDCVRFIGKSMPKVVILIDYCGFNFYLAKAAKKLKIPVIYYICPQLWAHGPWRIKKMKKLVDKVIVIYPFEKDFYEKAGVDVSYVGHPLFDETGKRNNNSEISEKQKAQTVVVSLLPGSRKQEITRHLPLLLQSAVQINQKIPSSQFLISCSGKRQFHLINSIAKEFKIGYRIITDNVHEVITSSDICIAGSGTITLQIAYYHKPMIIIYKISPFAYFVGKPFLITPYIGLVNVLANKEIVPEKLMYGKNYSWITKQALQLLQDNQRRKTCEEEIARLMDAIGRPGASEKAANEILAFMKRKTDTKG